MFSVPMCNYFIYFFLAESTAHFISKLELVAMETDVLGCTTNQHLARFVSSFFSLSCGSMFWLL